MDKDVYRFFKTLKSKSFYYLVAGLVFGSIGFAFLQNEDYKGFAVCCLFAIPMLTAYLVTYLFSGIGIIVFKDANDTEV